MPSEMCLWWVPLLPPQVEAIKAEMRECVSRVTRGRALLDLAAVFQVGRVVEARVGGSGGCALNGHVIGGCAGVRPSTRLQLCHIHPLPPPRSACTVPMPPAWWLAYPSPPQAAWPAVRCWAPTTGTCG